MSLYDNPYPVASTPLCPNLRPAGCHSNRTDTIDICVDSVQEGMVQLSTALDLLTPLQFTGGFLQYAIVFFVLALIAAAVGARGVAGISMEIARIFIVVFVILAIVSLLL